MRAGLAANLLPPLLVRLKEEMQEATDAGARGLWGVCGGSVPLVATFAPESSAFYFFIKPLHILRTWFA